MVFFFTGTGNSLYIAKQLDSDVISIPRIINNEDLRFIDERVGIVCPIYGHEMPAMVKEFIKRATFDTQYFYVILTYGAMHGGAADIADKYIQSVGKKADYINSIMMVDNFLPNFDMLKQEKTVRHVMHVFTHVLSMQFNLIYQSQRLIQRQDIGMNTLNLRKL